MSLISGSDEASLCYTKISQEQEELASPALFRTKIESVSVPYTQTERMAVSRHLQSFERHCRAVHMDSRAVAYAQIAMNPNKTEQNEAEAMEGFHEHRFLQQERLRRFCRTIFHDRRLDLGAVIPSNG